MKTGISTASMFGKKNTEDALSFLSEHKIKTAEVFLSTYCEYDKSFGEFLLERKGDVDVHSVHVLTTQFEPQLYSINPRAQADSFLILDKVMEVAKLLNASYYTFHGVARLKKTPIKLDFDRIGNITSKIMEHTLDKGVTLAYENVHWSYYNYIGFFNELKKRVPTLKGTLDIKQARQSDVDYAEFISEMGKDIVTVHLSDIDNDGKMCLPGFGKTDFETMFKRLFDVGFDGALLIESYSGDYSTFDELIESLSYITNLAQKVSGKKIL